MPDFSTRRHFVEHLNAHVLSPSESYAWGLIWQERFACLNPDDVGDNECFRLRNLSGQMESDARFVGDAPGMPLSQPNDDSKVSDREVLWLRLASEYRNEIVRAIARSQRLQWHTSRDGAGVYFDPCGIIVICYKLASKPTVSTAYIAGFSSSEVVSCSSELPGDVHARVGSGSRMRRHTGENQGGLRERLQSRRATNWNAAQKIYYLVFRPALRFIRGRQPTAAAPAAYGSNVRGNTRNESTDKRRVDMAEVKAALPRRSRLEYDDWRNYLIEAEGEPMTGSLS